MTTFVALLRAVNVGGTGKLPMAELKAMCCAAGFARVQTYIASGNVVFESKAARTAVKSAIEKRLLAHAGKPVGVVLRTDAEMQAVLEANPFPKGAPNHTYVVFLNERPPGDALENAVGTTGEEIRLGAAFMRRQTELRRSAGSLQGADGVLAAAVVDFCHAILNANEMLYVD